MNDRGPDVQLCVAGCIGLCAEALRRIQQEDVLAVPTETCSHNIKNRCTVGIMLSGLTIDQMVVGGPAYNSGQLNRGDVILEVDKKAVSGDNVLAALLGSDIPGSTFTVSVRKTDGSVKDVSLTRMATEVIADRRQMFELFTTLKDRARSDRNATAVAAVDECIELWTRMLLADAAHDRKVAEDVQLMQRDCTASLQQLSILLDRIQNILPKHLEDISTSHHESERSNKPSEESFEDIRQSAHASAKAEMAASIQPLALSLHTQLQNLVSEAAQLEHSIGAALLAAGTAEQKYGDALRRLNAGQSGNRSFAGPAAELAAAKDAARRAEALAAEEVREAAALRQQAAAKQAELMRLSERLRDAQAEADAARAAAERGRREAAGVAAVAAQAREAAAAAAAAQVREAALALEDVRVLREAALADGLPRARESPGAKEAYLRSAVEVRRRTGKGNASSPGGAGGRNLKGEEAERDGVRWEGLRDAIREVEELRVRMEAMAPLEPTDEACYRVRSRLLASLP